jgi:Fe-S-cluster containining protein
MMGFGCTKCGACCLKAKEILKGQVFPYEFLEDGRCEKYDPSVGCTIYENRPDVCNIEKGYLVYDHLLPMSKSAYYDISALNCNRWQKELGIDKSLRVTKTH